MSIGHACESDEYKRGFPLHPSLSSAAIPNQNTMTALPLARNCSGPARLRPWLYRCIGGKSIGATSRIIQHRADVAIIAAIATSTVALGGRSVVCRGSRLASPQVISYFQRSSAAIWTRLPQVSFTMAMVEPETLVGGMVNSAPAAFMRSYSRGTSST